MFCSQISFEFFFSVHFVVYQNNVRKPQLIISFLIRQQLEQTLRFISKYRIFVIQFSRISQEHHDGSRRRQEEAIEGAEEGIEGEKRDFV